MTIDIVLKNGESDFLDSVQKIKQDKIKFEVFSEYGNFIFKIEEIEEVIIDF